MIVLIICSILDLTKVRRDNTCFELRIYEICFNFALIRLFFCVSKAFVNPALSEFLYFVLFSHNHWLTVPAVQIHFVLYGGQREFNNGRR